MKKFGTCLLMYIFYWVLMKLAVHFLNADEVLCTACVALMLGLINRYDIKEHNHERM